MNKGLEIKNLNVATTEGKTIFSNVSVRFEDNKNYALVGRNGSGKSTLVSAIMGHPHYQVTGGQILLDGKDITNLSPDERAKRGLFLAMQYPAEIPGVSYANFLRTALGRLTGNQFNFLEVLERLQREAKALGFKDFDYNRDLNVGFSGGEKKKSEILQMLILKPRFAFLDEPDSGLDKISVKRLSERLAQLDFPTSLIVISHHDKLLETIKPESIYDMEQLEGLAGGADLDED